MDHTAVLALFDRQMRCRTTPPGAAGPLTERSGRVVRQVGADGDWSGVLWSDLTADTADADIAEQVRYFTGRGLAFEWKLYSHDAPRDLAGRLLAAGFRPEPEETVLVAETSGLPAVPELPDGVRLEAVTGPAGVELTMRVHDRAFGTDGTRLRQQLLAQLAQTPDTVLMTVAMAGDLPVCAARIEFTPGTDFAGLWGGGTRPEWRGRGIYRALVAHRAAAAARRGVRYLQVDASDHSRPILERLGFAALATTTPYVYEP
ncbi:GNAT family N-acetyltransferase [Streptomyces sp. PKU-EA00015]|uniref:GNAT family N-acetyltransferase n=1 Tax=Streptomyces sp. PKU-EA00015 TaxID=2748326 RepID=UPI0015A3E5A5|nr:GNAT family N-acetyltransferase [Streptomyces sp. PKU-EA00015]NWF25188.1 GNAT family N-acetyltransferase [Streptomyces sp. PKU-EA00015]